jgi:putative glutamine amidotransferase
MKSPIIGLVASFSAAKGQQGALFSVGEAYVQAILQAGGVPVLLPPVLSGVKLESLLTRLDGILFTGGSDIDPARFGGPAHPRVYGIDPQRDELEIQLVQRATEQGTPFLGICRGTQAINVALGGTLYTDIADQHPQPLKHDFFPDYPRNHPAHAITIQPGSRVERILGAQSLTVNSLHHQGINSLAPALRAVAFAPDGLIEAVELVNHPFAIGLQWHPECLQDQPPHQALFRALVTAAEQQAANSQ